MMKVSVSLMGEKLIISSNQLIRIIRIENELKDIKHFPLPQRKLPMRIKSYWRKFMIILPTIP